MIGRSLGFMVRPPVANFVRPQNLPRLLCLLHLLAGAMLVTFDIASAQDLPSPDILRAIAAKLPHQPPAGHATFQPSNSGATDAVCKMQRFTMTLAAGTASAHAVPVLLDQRPMNGDAPITLLATLHRVTVDADGSPRTYHPDDPHGTGTCTSEIGPDGKERYSGVCALDDFASAHLLVFQGARRLLKGEFEGPWRSIWPLIRDKKLPAIDLKQYVATAPDGYYFFYWKERGLIAFFKREIITQAADGYPCRHDTGYFVAATTLQQDGESLPDGCTPARFMDAEQIPFFVLPDDGFGRARVGDIVIGRLAGAPPDRVVYGVVGDTGPIAQIGEGSIAFNQALLAKSNPIMNFHDIDPLDINGAAVTILVLGGTKTLLNGDYSRQNIETIGRQEFARWNDDPSNPTRRLDACVRGPAPVRPKQSHKPAGRSAAH